MKPTLKQYAFWQTTGPNDEDAGYWNAFDSLEDAVTEANGEDIYELNAKKLGKFDIKVIRRIKKRKPE